MHRIRHLSSTQPAMSGAVHLLLDCSLMQGTSSDDELHRAQRDLVSATEAAAANGPSSGVSAFAAPALQTGSASDVSQAKDLLGKVR